MDERSADEELIAKFGAALALIHGRQVNGVKRDLRKLASPNSEHDLAISAYYEGMDRDQLIIALSQSAIEGVFHDLFFLFDEHEEFKLMLKRGDGSEIDLAQAVDVIQAFPMSWFEKASSAGHEGGRRVAFLSEKLNLGETRQDRRARILAEKTKTSRNDPQEQFAIQLSRDGLLMRAWLWQNKITLLTVAAIALYAAFIEWFFGWGSILAGWQAVGVWTILLTLLLLVGTYFIRTHRMQDYFPRETSGQFLKLFRVTQVHNLLNIMLPFRAGETSFPLLMRSEFGVPLAHGTSALLVLRLLDLHALLAAAGLGLVASASRPYLAATLWALFLLLPLILFPLKNRLIAALRKRLPERLATLVDEIDDGLPRDVSAFTRAWMLTVLNWGVKVLVLAWVLGLMGVLPIAAAFGGALGGEISSVLPVHAPAGVGTYPAGIGAGAAAFGSARDAATLEVLAKASINTHLLMIVSALLGTGLSLILPSMFVRKSPAP